MAINEAGQRAPWAGLENDGSLGVVLRGYTLNFDTDDCVLWPLHIGKNGYGYKSDRSLAARVVLAHRWVYAKVNGAIPEGMAIDHLCRVRACVNPRHLEVVTYGTNNARARAAGPPRSTCRAGHDISGEGSFLLVDGGKRRRCKECARKWSANYRATHREHIATYKRLWSAGRLDVDRL